ncbi:hypothetical protein BGZ70_009314 [Mortierella alpina]|uniref:EF-hand domain-containing protein n=1 Tax=Mortierella alpina TaxID=64518 RepID=A0A9P6J1Q4_MORAP|nr:hypothetical protein BGZ70_009314 [Mortierella alpina]
MLDRRDLENMFAKHDKNADGRLNNEELLAFLAELGLSSRADQASNFIKAHGGGVNWTEFLSLYAELNHGEEEEEEE